ncbi:MAG: hypothetical protein WCW54_01405 [Candidatus Paceibacterota bacterium]
MENKEFNLQIDGEFNGFNDGAVFKLTNGQVWQQKRYKYMYRYAYRPYVRIYRDGTKWILEVKLTGCEPIEVIKVDIIQEGPIVSNFKGFFQNARFEFQNGNIWEQAEYKYNYHYAFRPHAVIINGVNGYELSVDGMSETVRVKRTR